MQADWHKRCPPEIVNLGNRDSFCLYIAREFLHLGVAVQKRHGYFRVIFGGGRTPVAVNTRIVEMAPESEFDWKRVIVFFSDERCVAPDNPDSNYNMIFRTFVMPLGIPDNHVYRIEGELGPEEAARRYQLNLSQAFGNENVPTFDLALLGMGPDGHTASLFPHNSALGEKSRWAVPAGKGPEGLDRITLTYPVLNAAKNVWFMISGPEKRNAVTNLLHGPLDPEKWPAQGISPVNGKLVYVFGEGLEAMGDGSWVMGDR